MAGLTTQDAVFTKLKFIPYKDVTFNEGNPVFDDTKQGTPYTVMFNPNNIAVKLQVEWDAQQADGTTNAPLKFKKIQPQDYSFEFVIDGTGATGDKRDVPEDVKKFLSTVYEYDSAEHTPHYLKITYGSVLLKCILKSVDITYNLFAANGKPLRAKVNASFTSCADPLLSEAIQNSNSPDMTHVRMLKTSDKLIGISNKIYKNNTHYVEVARANNFDTFRNLPTGTEILLPPVSKT